MDNHRYILDPVVDSELEANKRTFALLALRPESETGFSHPSREQGSGLYISPKSRSQPFQRRDLGDSRLATKTSLTEIPLISQLIEEQGEICTCPNVSEAFDAEGLAESVDFFLPRDETLGAISQQVTQSPLLEEKNYDGTEKCRASEATEIGNFEESVDPFIPRNETLGAPYSALGQVNLSPLSQETDFYATEHCSTSETTVKISSVIAFLPINETLGISEYTF